MKPNIVILDAYSVNPGDLNWSGLDALGQLTVYDRTNPGEVWERIKAADAVLTNKVVIDSGLISKMHRCKYIGVLATGYNVVDIARAAEAGITVTNIPSYSTMSVVQTVFAHLLAITNKVEAFTAENRNGRWSRNPDFCYWDTPLMELAGHNMGIIGLGNIGSGVARVAAALGMNVLAYTSKNPTQLPGWIQPVPMARLLAESDIVTLHCRLTEKTRHMINADTLRQMKPGAILINTGRGPLIDEQAVANALHDGHLRAACVDVLGQEPPAADNPLLHAPNCTVTPHIAWATLEARTRLIDIATDNLRSFIHGQPVNVVNKP